MGKRSGSTKSTRFNAASGLTQMGAGTLRTPEADKLLSQLKGKLTQKEIDALSAYAYGSDQDINRMLRGLSKPADQAKIRDLVRQIDSAMDKSSGITSKSVLYRGIDNIKSFPAGFFNGVVAGKTFTEKAYTSTSFNVQGFNSRFGNSDVVLKIVAPAGTKGVPMHRGHGKTTGVEYEKEFLLPRGTTYKVVSHKTRTSRSRGGFGGGDTRHYLTVQIVNK